MAPTDSVTDQNSELLPVSNVKCVTDRKIGQKIYKYLCLNIEKVEKKNIYFLIFKN